MRSQTRIDKVGKRWLQMVQQPKDSRTLSQFRVNGYVEREGERRSQELPRNAKSQLSVFGVAAGVAGVSGMGVVSCCSQWVEVCGKNWRHLRQVKAACKRYANTINHIRKEKWEKWETEKLRDLMRCMHQQRFAADAAAKRAVKRLDQSACVSFGLFPDSPVTMIDLSSLQIPSVSFSLILSPHLLYCSSLPQLSKKTGRPVDCLRLQNKQKYLKHSLRYFFHKCAHLIV